MSYSEVLIQVSVLSSIYMSRRFFYDEPREGEDRTRVEWKRLGKKHTDEIRQLVEDEILKKLRNAVEKSKKAGYTEKQIKKALYNFPGGNAQFWDADQLGKDVSILGLSKDA